MPTTTPGHLTAEYKAATADYKAWYNKGWYYATEGANGLDHGDGIGAPDAWYDGYMDLAVGRDKWHAITCKGCEEHEEGSSPAPTPDPELVAGTMTIDTSPSSVTIPKRVVDALAATGLPIEVAFDPESGNSGLVGNVWINARSHWVASGCHTLALHWYTNRPAAWDNLLARIAEGVESGEAGCDGCDEQAI